MDEHIFNSIVRIGNNIVLIITKSKACLRVETLGHYCQSCQWKLKRPAAKVLGAIGKDSRCQNLLIALKTVLAFAIVCMQNVYVFCSLIGTLT